jgi:hypothetical protein
VPQLFDPALAITVFAFLSWLGISVVVVSVCRAAAQADIEMGAMDEAVAMSGPLGWLLSQAPSRQNVADGAEEDLYVPPERPVRHIQVVDRSHLS